MDNQVDKMLAEPEKSREGYRGRISALLNEVGNHYQKRGVAELYLHQGHDIHAFYRLSHDPTKVIHVQVYPGMSTEDGAIVYARMMDYDRMMEIRSSGIVSVGNEHEATIQVFPNFKIGMMIPYDSKVLEDILAENVPELK